MKLCIVKKMMSKAILTMVLVGIGLLMSAFSRGRVMMVSAAETTSTNNTVDVKVVPVQGDSVKKEEIHKADGTEQMLFAGWFTDAACENAITRNTTVKSSSTYYAKYVDAKTLSIKLQLRENSDGTTDMRIVSSVDCLEYESVGFDIYFNNGEKTSYVPFKTGTVQKRINVTSQGVPYDFSPKVIDSASEYFVSATIKKIAENKRDCDFYIKPYWVTKSGAKVYGQSRYLSTTDGLDAGNINIPVEMVKPQGTSIGVQINNKSVNAEVAYYEEETGCAHLNIPVQDVQVGGSSINDRTKLSAATKIQVSNDVQVIYRNYINSSIDVDTSWYDVNTDSNEFVIAKEADLKGLASIVNGGTELFKDDTVILVSDVAVNEGTVAEGTSNWEKWTPIGTAEDGKRFSGTFEGDNNIISGIYMTNSTISGLFGGTETGSMIQNLRLTESYFSVSDRSLYQLGSVVADCHGSLANVYSDAVIHSAASNSGTDMNTGGLVATLNAWDYQNNCTGTINITNCWYEGTITLGNKTICVGGVVGDITKGVIMMDACLFTGKILDGNTSHSIDYVGGLFGDISESSYETRVNITACISAGEIHETWEAVDPGSGVGAIGGYFSFASSDTTGTANSVYLNLDKVYATRECFAKAVTTGSSTHPLLDANGNAMTDAEGNAITAETVVTGTPIWTYNNDRLVGYCTELTGESLDFAEDWVLRTDGVPVPQTMEDVVGFSNIVESNVSLEKQVGLDLFGKQVSAATNMGAGNYVHTVTGKTYADYQTYINRLKELDFKAHVSLEDGTETDDGTAIDGVYNAVYAKEEGNWSLSITYVENLETLYVTIHTGGVASLSPHLIYDSYDKNRQHDMAGEVSFTMSQLTKEDKTGNQFILRLPNGHFIINDGGHSTELRPMLETLKMMAQEVGMQEVHIDAWIISHQHVDHAGVLSGVNTLVKDKQQSILESVYVEGIYLSEPNYQTQLLEGTGGMDNVLSNQYLGMRWLKNSDREQTPIYRYNTGQRYYFSGVCLDVIQSQEVLPIHDKSVWVSEGIVNSVSTTFVYTMNNEEKIFWSGDATHLNSDYIMKAYGSVEEGETLSELLYESESFIGIVTKRGTLDITDVVTGTNKVAKSSQMLSGISVYITPHHGTNTTLPYSNWLATTYGEMVDGNYKFDTVLFPYYRFRLTGEGEMAGTDNAPYEETQDYANEWLRDHLVGDGGMHHYGNGSITLTFEKIDTSEGEDTDEPNWSLPF